jgi:hypothetical protein
VVLGSASTVCCGSCEINWGDRESSALSCNISRFSPPTNVRSITDITMRGTASEGNMGSIPANSARLANGVGPQIGSEGN